MPTIAVVVVGFVLLCGVLVVAASMFSSRMSQKQDAHPQPGPLLARPVLRGTCISGFACDGPIDDIVEIRLAEVERRR